MSSPCAHGNPSSARYGMSSATTSSSAYPRLEGGPGRRGAIPRARTKRDVFVAVTDGRPVGFVAVALNAFHEGMGVIDIIGVDPDFQRRGISFG